MSQEPASNNPGENEVIEMTVDNILMDVHTCMPGVVVSYDAGTQTATVQPSLKRSINGSPVSLPQIQNVPVLFPATANAWVRLPVAAGDRVMLHFSERSLDQWWVKGGEVDPLIPHKFSLTDAIAVPGLNPKPKAIVAKGAATSLEVALGGAWLEITAQGKFKITNGTVELLTVLDSILSHLIALTTINCVVGSPVSLSPATITQLNLDQANLEALKA